MVKSIGIDSAATNLSWSSVSKSAGLKSSITIFLHTFTQSRKSDMLLDQSVKSSEGSFAFRPRSQKSRFWTDCIRPLAFPATLCTSSAVKLVRWLPDWILETIGFRCETLRQFCVKLLRPVIAWLTTYDHWLLLRNFAPVSGVKFLRWIRYLLHTTIGFCCETLHQFWCETVTVIVLCYRWLAKFLCTLAGIAHFFVFLNMLAEVSER